MQHLIEERLVRSKISVRHHMDGEQELLVTASSQKSHVFSKISYKNQKVVKQKWAGKKI